MSNGAPPDSQAPELRRSSRAPNVLRRLLLLALCIAAGCAVGFAGLHFSGSPSWFLAVPLFMVLAWVFVANPTECFPPGERPAHNGSASE